MDTTKRKTGFTKIYAGKPRAYSEEELLKKRLHRKLTTVTLDHITVKERNILRTVLSDLNVNDLKYVEGKADSKSEYTICKPTTLTWKQYFDVKVENAEKRLKLCADYMKTELLKTKKPAVKFIEGPAASQPKTNSVQSKVEKRKPAKPVKKCAPLFKKAWQQCKNSGMH
jgi:hypothetical protein